jgi:hypothetical protein
LKGLNWQQEYLKTCLPKHRDICPSKGIAFTNLLEIPDAQHAFKTIYEYSTPVPRDLQRLKQIKDIPCLILWEKMIN